MDETTLGPTGGNISEAKREGPESPRPAPLMTRLVARMLDFVILFLIFGRFTGPIRESFARFVFDLFPCSLRIRVFLIDAHDLNVGFLLFTGFLMVSCICLLCDYWGLSRSGQSLGKRMEARTGRTRTCGTWVMATTESRTRRRALVYVFNQKH